jgi:epsilon-lactone hydrolase
MASEPLTNVMTLLRANRLPDDAPLADLRQWLETFATVTPPADDVACAPVEGGAGEEGAGGVPAEWVIAAGARDNAVVLYLHGGGYALGSIATHRRLAGEVSRATGAKALLIDYRLAPEHPYPAAVDDAVAAYRWLLDQGHAPAKLAVSGDSAGGGLAVAMLLALRDQGIPLPACAVPISPWVDMEASAESYTTCADIDPMVSQGGIKRFADWYLAGQDLAGAPYASPLHGDLSGLPPLLVQVGEAEVLRDDSTQLVDKARAAGVDATCEVSPDCPHVFHALPGVPEAEEALARLGAFVRTHLDP